MIWIVVGAILFVIGAAMLLRSVIAIAVSLIVICFDLVKLAGCLVIATLAGSLLLGQWIVKHVSILVRWIRGLPEPEPCIAITINYPDEDADDIARTIELPRESFRRLRG
jgi:hypothetical protein